MKTLITVIALLITFQVQAFDRYNIDGVIPYELFVDSKEDIKKQSIKILPTISKISGVSGNTNQLLVYGFNEDWKRSIIYVYIHQD